MTLGERIFKLRKLSGMTQTDFAKALHAKGARAQRIAISRWENDHSVPATWQLIYIAEIFGVSIDYLVDGESQHINNKEREFIELMRRSKDIKKIVDCLSLMSDVQIKMTSRIVHSIISDSNEA